MVANELDMIDRPRHVTRIDDEPVLGVGLAVELLADQLAHLRACTVRADQVAGTDRVRMAVLVGQRRNDAVAFVDETFERHPECDVHVVALAQPRAQAAFEIGLVERHEFRMAVERAERIDPREFTERGRAHPDVRDRHRVEIAFVDARHLQDAQRFVVERDGARRHEDPGRLVDHHDLHAVTRQQVRERGADRPEPDDQDVGRRRQPARVGLRRATRGARMRARCFKCLHRVSIRLSISAAACDRMC